MSPGSIARIMLLMLLTAPVAVTASGTEAEHHRHDDTASPSQYAVQLGPRPFWLVDDMDDSALKQRLESCKRGPFRKADFSIGHRGAAMQFPEHTRESYIAAARMGAGIVECDVTFTKDRGLVCRHSQCDLHTTTNILATPLAATCRKPFTPADPVAGTPAGAECCTSDITVAQFKTLQGKMDAADPRATTVAQYLDGTASWRTDLYASRGTLLTHAESLELFKSLGVKVTPELKSASVPMPFEGYTQQQYAQQLIDELRTAGIPPQDAWPQSFNLEDVRYWIANEPRYGEQAVYLDGRDRAAPPIDPMNPATWSPSMETLRAEGVRIIAPPTWMLLTLDSQKRIVPSEYAKRARAAGLSIITWSLERSGPLATGGGYYYRSIRAAIDNDGDQMNVIDVLANDVGVIGIFSDWPATTTFFANCFGLR